MTFGRAGTSRIMPRSRAAWQKVVVPAAATLVLLWLFSVVCPVLFANAQRTFDSDEARHAVNGLQIAADIVHLQGLELVEHLYRQPWYPPALSLYLAPFFVAVGPSYWAARFPMVILLVANCALAYRTAMKIWSSPVIALLALVLVSTSSLMWKQGLLCMEEMLAVCGTSLVILAWVRRQRQASGRRRRLAEWILGLCVGLTSFARTSTGIFVAGAVLAAVWSLREPVRSKVRTTVRVFGPTIAALALWWATPVKLPGLLDYLQASRPASELLFSRAVAVFGQEMVASFAVAPMVGIILMVAVVVAVLRWRDSRARILLLIVFVSWGGLLVRRSLTARFFVGAFPAACLIEAKGIHDLFGALRQRLPARLARWLVPALAVALAGYVGVWANARVASLAFVMDVSYETEQGHRETLDWIAERVGAGPTFLINGWDQASAEALDFHVARTLWPSWTQRTVTDITLEDPNEHPETVEQFRVAAVSASPSRLIHLGNTPVASAGAWWAYRAAISSCWDGEWVETSSFWVRLWDQQAQTRVLSQPFAFRHDSNQQKLRDQLSYPFLVEVSRAACSE